MWDEGRIDPTVTSIENNRLVRTNFEVCPPQHVSFAVRKESATPGPKQHAWPDARENFHALLSKRHNCLLNSSSVLST